MNDLEAGLYTHLTGGTALTALLAGTASVYPREAPEDASYDYVIYTYMGGGELPREPNTFQNLVYVVKGVSQTSLSTAGQIAEQIKARLKDQTFAVTGWTVLSAWVEDPIRYVEYRPDGRPAYHAGWNVRFQLYES